MHRPRPLLNPASARLLLSVLMLTVLAACRTGEVGAEPSTTNSSPEPSSTVSVVEPTGPITLTLITHDSFFVSEGILETFTLGTGIDVELLQAGDAGAMLSQVILTKDNPLADVMYGVDNTFLSRAANAEIFDPYLSTAVVLPTDLIPADQQVTPIAFGDVCLNYRTDALGELAPPASLDDLIKPEYNGTLVVQNPTISSPGLAFLLSTIDAYGEDGWQEYWRQLFENGVEVTAGWEESYNGPFATGERPLVVSYASSPPAEVIFADPPVTEAPTGVVTDGCYRQIEYAGVLAGTNYPTEARQLVDFMLSTVFQEDIPLNMFVFPANPEAELPPEFVEYTELPEQPNALDPQLVEANRERWLREWDNLFTS